MTATIIIIVVLFKLEPPVNDDKKLGLSPLGNRLGIELKETYLDIYIYSKRN
jgi:hypothetical protein